MSIRELLSELHLQLNIAELAFSYPSINGRKGPKPGDEKRWWETDEGMKFGEHTKKIKGLLAQLQDEGFNVPIAWGKAIIPYAVVTSRPLPKKNLRSESLLRAASYDLDTIVAFRTDVLAHLNLVGETRRNNGSNDRKFYHAELAELAGMKGRTLNTYAKRAGAPTADVGENNFKHEYDNATKIMTFIAEQASTKKHRTKARGWLVERKQIANKS